MTIATTAGATTLFVRGFQLPIGVMPVRQLGTVTLAANQSVNVAQVGGTTTVTGGVAGTFGIGGTTASGTAVANNPVQIGCEARTTQRAAGVDGAVSRPVIDSVGRTVVKAGQVRALHDNNAITLSSTTETTLVAAVTAIFQDVYSLHFSNTSASPTRVDIRDSAAGTVRFSVQLVANQSYTWTSPLPLKQATVNTAWTAQLSAAVTDVRITSVSERVL
jgi:hypothetical protein